MANKNEKNVEVQEIEKVENIEAVTVENTVQENPVVEPVQNELSEKEIDNLAKKTGATLKEEEKTSIRIPIDPLNPKDTIVPVCINGYPYHIKRGERVSVPKTVADILEESGYL